MEMTLKQRFAPAQLEVIDESSRHLGHAGARPEGETHYRLRLVSGAFDGLTRVARQRLVYEALREEFAAGLHALSLELRSEREAAQN